MEPDTEQRLIASAQRGDLDAFNQLVEQYERLVFAVSLRLLRDYQYAEDVTQDAFLRAYSSLAQYSGGSFRAWLTRIATNRCYDVLRTSHRRPAESLDERPFEEQPHWSLEPLPDDPERLAIHAELGHRLERALDLLPEEQRLVVFLYDVHGYDYEEIAQISNISLGTVKSRLSRARARLRDLLNADKESRELFEAVRRHLSDDDSVAEEEARQHGKAERAE
ncbi:MAG: sigma-70 family RNA polymerase sigma factor [Nitrolancea sp.]